MVQPERRIPAEVPGGHSSRTILGMTLQSSFSRSRGDAGGGFVARRQVERLIGAGIFASLLLLGAGLFSSTVPYGGAEPIALLARLAEGARIYLLLLAGLTGLGIALAGARRSGLVIAAVAVGGLAWMAVDYRARVAPAGEQADLTVLWFNVLYDNPLGAGELASAIRNSGADVVFLTEINRMEPEIGDVLSAEYPHQDVTCGKHGDCGIHVFSRFPFKVERSRRFSLGAARLRQVEMTLPDGRRLQLLATHWGKTWSLSQSHKDRFVARHVIRDIRDDEPLIMLGDFNAAPWSRRLLDLERDYGFRHAPLPVATWPVTLGSLGVPIDHVLLRGDAGLVSLQSWGRELDSNHLGLLARIDLGVSG